MPSGLLGGLLAASVIVNCTVVNFHPRPTLVCSDRKELLLVPYAEWPAAWHGPELGFTYQFIPATDTEDAIALPSTRDGRALAESIRKSRNEQRRWMREAVQNPRREP